MKVFLQLYSESVPSVILKVNSSTTGIHVAHYTNTTITVTNVAISVSI